MEKFLYVLPGLIILLIAVALRIARYGAGRHKPLDGFAPLAFALAMFIMVFPIESDVVHSLLMARREGIAGLVSMGCITIVLVPTTISWRRQLRQPGMWRGRGYLIAATVILLLNLMMTICLVIVISLHGGYVTAD